MYHARIMAVSGGPVKVQNTRNMDRLASAFIDLVGFLSSPRRDGALLREARVSLDRALFPLLVRLDAVRSVRASGGGNRVTVRLAGGDELEASRGATVKLKARLGL